MPIAVNMIRDQPHYRRDAFETGLKRAGYKLVSAPPGRPTRDDVLVVWNRSAHMGAAADKWEAAGGTVLVAENGYAGQDKEGRQFYALAKHGHNGSGRWPVVEGRWEALGIEMRPWCNAANGHILIPAQRGIGSKTMASPHAWHGKAAGKLRATQRRPVVVRPHPHGKKPARPLEADLAGAWVTFIWGSSVGVRSLIAGIPVVYDAPHFICEGCCTRGMATVGAPMMDDTRRLAALQRMAAAQWSVDELASGEPFVLLKGV